MLKLYARKGAGSDAVEALLAVLGIPHAVEYLSKGADGYNPASLKAVNPRGEVPTLVLAEGTVLTESAAMMLFLADAYPHANLAPALTSPLRPDYLRWMLFLAAALYASALLYYYPHRFCTEAAAEAGVKAKAKAAMDRDFAIFADVVGDKPYTLGDTLSALDIYAAMLVTWAGNVPTVFARHPNLKAMCVRVKAHPAIAEVWAHIEI